MRRRLWPDLGRLATRVLLPIALVIVLSAVVGGTLVAAVSMLPSVSSPVPKTVHAGGPTVVAEEPAAPGADPVAQAGRPLARLPGLGPAVPDAAPPPGPRGHLTVPSVGLSVAVLGYDDCTGRTALTRSAAVHDHCTPAAVTALVGHNPGVFTPLLSTHDGDILLYRTEAGVDRTYRLRGAPVRDSPTAAAAATQDSSFAHMVLATCAVPDSSSYWVFVAVPVDGGPGSTAAAPPPTTAPAPDPTPTDRGILSGLGL
jgi:hypothetical protein